MSNYSELFEKAIAAEMRAQKARKNMTEAEIADRIGVHRVSISRYLSGARPLPLGIFADLCRVLGLDAFEVVNIAEIQAKKAASDASESSSVDGSRGNSADGPANDSRR